MSSLDALPAVDLTPSGTFKYITIQATTKSGSKMLIRGYAGCEYHQDVLDMALAKARAVVPDVEMACVGGGRIVHTPPPCAEGRANVFIYGYSQAFGAGNHSMAADMVRAHFDGYTVEWSNDGY